ncbi:IS66 family insertion sequence element accessory protein TnpA [Seongchinamella sediminis]|uniref:IS66 family insertion sequence element accessory protein TnpA n=1 Tax=Seongchinamella sediminis TaxID=2283635 RepID=UPI003B834225
MLDDFHRSGLTKVAFCQQHGVATSSLNRWQRVLEKPEGGDFVDVTAPLSRAPAAPASGCDPDNAWQVELALGNGIVLRIRTA